MDPDVGEGLDPRSPEDRDGLVSTIGVLTALGAVGVDEAVARLAELADALLPPGVGWMQGAAGIAAFLLRISRLLPGGPGGVPRMENWWALPHG